jgi:hypothetical protein
VVYFSYCGINAPLAETHLFRRKTLEQRQERELVPVQLTGISASASARPWCRIFNARDGGAPPTLTSGGSLSRPSGKTAAARFRAILPLISPANASAPAEFACAPILIFRTISMCCAHLRPSPKIFALRKPEIVPT